MAKTVIIGCKLPHGIVLKGTAGQNIELNGMNKSLVAGGFGITHVDEMEANYMFGVYSDFGPFKSNAIFTNSTPKVADLAAMADELSDERTGFEGVNPEAPAPNLKPEGDVSKALDAAASQPRPARAPKAAADKAAANELAGNE